MWTMSDMKFPTALSWIDLFLTTVEMDSFFLSASPDALGLSLSDKELRSSRSGKSSIGIKFSSLAP